MKCCTDLLLQCWFFTSEYFNLLLFCSCLEKYIWEISILISKNDDNNKFFLPQKKIYTYKHIIRWPKHRWLEYLHRPVIKSKHHPLYSIINCNYLIFNNCDNLNPYYSYMKLGHSFNTEGPFQMKKNYDVCQKKLLHL